jgi:hypothetical protein
MAVHIICPPGHYGGIISGTLDPKIGILPEEIAVYQRIGVEWSVRKLGVTAARLWSCDLGYDPEKYVDEWMACVVSRGFDPHREPKEGDRVFQVTQTLASSLSAHLVVRDAQPSLEGAVWSVRRRRRDSVFRFVFWGSQPIEEDAPPFGWDPLDFDDPMDYESDTWGEAVAPAPQFAVIQVKADFSNQFIDHPEDIELPGANQSDTILRAIRRKKLKILPTRHAQSTAFTSCIDVKILSSPGPELSGVVTGLGCAFDHVRKLGDDDVPEEGELLRVWAWSIDAAGMKTPVAPVLCRPSGYWVFDQLPAEAQHAAGFAIAVSTQQIELPVDDFPVPGGEVIAFRQFERQPSASATVPVPTQQ